MAGQAPLALPAVAHGQEAGWRRNADMIDALPYIDGLSAEEKKQVDALIADECKRSVKRPTDYLAELPALPPMQFQGHPLLAAEYERVKSKQPMPPLDTSRYRLDPPPQTKRGDVGAWKVSLDNALSQLEHQQTRIQNLELLLKFGDKSWRAEVQAHEATLQSYEADLNTTRKAVTALNQERKLSQVSAGNQLRQVTEEYMSVVFKNHEIEQACEALEHEIDRLKEQLGGGPAAVEGTSDANGTAGASSGQGQAQGMEVDEPAAAPHGNGHVHD